MSFEVKSCPKISVLCNEKQSISKPVQLDILIGKDIMEEILLLKRQFWSSSRFTISGPSYYVKRMKAWNAN